MFVLKKVFFSSLMIVSLFTQVPAAFGQSVPKRVLGLDYVSDSVTFVGKKTGLCYGATITIPKSGPKHTAVILVSGTGPQDRNGTMAGHQLFTDIANYLTSKGIVVLRVDDRGVGVSTGDYSKATTADFANDVLEAFAYLKSRSEVNQKRIGVIGHSEGGASSSIAASQEPGIAFIVSLAGLALNGYEALLIQNRDLVNSSPISKEDKERYHEINGIMFKVAYDNADSANLAKKLNNAYATWKTKDDAYVKEKQIQFDHFRFPIYSYVNQAISAWYRYFIKYDPATVLARVKVPILALNGDKDLMVSYQENLKNWHDLPGKSSKRNVTTKVFPGLNHLFLPCVKCDISEYKTITGTFSPQALDIIYEWIHQLK